MWYVCDVLYAVLYGRVNCFVVRGCGVSKRYIDVCYCDMFSVVNVYLDHLKFFKGITIANIYIALKTPPHHDTTDTDITNCIQYQLTNSIITGDVNAHSTLWHSYTDDHCGELISETLSNSNHITLNKRHPDQSAKQLTSTTNVPRHHHHIILTLQQNDLEDNPCTKLRPPTNTTNNTD